MSISDYNKRARLMKLMQHRWDEKKERLSSIKEYIKDQINSIEFSTHTSIVHLKDKRKFYWDINQFHSLGTLIRDGNVEPQESQVLERILAPNDIVIDIGANFGWYSTLLSKIVGPSGQVIAFEPLPSLFNELKSNIELNHMVNVITRCIALSNYSGNTALEYPAALGPEYASIDISYEVDNMVSNSCEVIELDTYLSFEQYDRINFIKIDVEGNELNVLQGAYETLKRYQPKLMIEIFEDQLKRYNSSSHDIYSYLNKLGYHLYTTELDIISSPEQLGNLTSRNIFAFIP